MSASSACVYHYFCKWRLGVPKSSTDVSRRYLILTLCVEEWNYTLRDPFVMDDVL
uniref:Uncharacterized protein n=1 Tax=Bartonella rochalimae ATCC BAA-1498 TaxID=685782 RepID=E6YN79_9HYPH|nr:hypothetical protein BARRO_120091 [Bartonella rochalimae ATCC BAA-1498]